jgi:hypothetical protein
MLAQAPHDLTRAAASERQASGLPTNGTPGALPTVVHPDPFGQPGVVTGKGKAGR